MEIDGGVHADAEEGGRPNDGSDEHGADQTRVHQHKKGIAACVADLTEVIVVVVAAAAAICCYAAICCVVAAVALICC